MRPRTNRPSRRGTILPLVAVSLIALCGFVALAVDVSMIAIAKNQCQNAADLSAMAGARTLNGSADSNVTAANANAQAAAMANAVLSVPIKSTDVTIQLGAYHYNSTTQTFQNPNPPVAPQSNENYTLARVQVTKSSADAFAQVLGYSTLPAVSAVSVAAHRPRDVCLVLDFSGSMNDESDLWNNVAPTYTYLGTVNNTPNNTDANFPTWGAYSATSSAQLQWTGTDPRVGQCNITISALGVPVIAGDFYQNAFGASAVAAFTPASSTYATTPGGDYYLKKNNQSTNTWAVTYKDINNGSTSKNSNFDTTSTTGGYTYYYNLNKSGTTFQGYMQGPGYWGKTFFVWPPDPSKDSTGTTRDWRQKFFMKTGGSSPSFGGACNDNTLLYSSGGAWNSPSGNYVINYKAILNWIVNTGPNPFPTRLRAGNILYYSAIPTDVPSSSYTYSTSNGSITNADQRFWKEYIDYVLGVWTDPYGNLQTPGNNACSIVPDFTWGTVSISAPPTGTGAAYMTYTDNPMRPGHRFWFGPMTMIQYLSDTGRLPGTAHDISMFPAKQGISQALQDIQNNHPNDLVSLLIYNRPLYSNDPSGMGAFNQPAASLSRNYQTMINSLWYPPNSSTADVRLWDANGNLRPSACNDYIYNTAMDYGMMLAFNQFSSNSSLQSSGSGGLGRLGASRLVILETDGMANADSEPASSFVNKGYGQSYFPILPGNTVNTGFNPSNTTPLLQAVQAICNTSSGSPGTSPGYSPNPGYPGYATAAKPVLIHTIAFGAMFEAAAQGSNQTQAVALLQQISQVGGTTFPSSSSDPTNGYKWCIGNLSQRQQRLRNALGTIMDGGVAVSLIQ